MSKPRLFDKNSNNFSSFGFISKMDRSKSSLFGRIRLGLESTQTYYHPYRQVNIEKKKETLKLHFRRKLHRIGPRSSLQVAVGPPPWAHAFAPHWFASNWRSPLNNRCVSTNQFEIQSRPLLLTRSFFFFLILHSKLLAMSLLILGVCLYLFIYLCCLSRVLSSCPLFYCWSRVFSYFVARLLLVTILLMLAPCLIVASRFLLTIHVTSLSRVIRYFLQTQILSQTLDSHWFFVFPFFCGVGKGVLR